MPTFNELSTAQLRQALQIREQIEGLQQKLSALLGGAASDSSSASKTRRAVGRPKGKRTMSASARAKIAAAQQARWAKVKGTATKSTGATKSATTSPKQKKGGLTTEGRAKLAAAMKARWAARKKGGPAPNASA